MSLKEHGAVKYGRLIQQNIDQARYLAGLNRSRARAGAGGTRQPERRLLPLCPA